MSVTIMAAVWPLEIPATDKMVLLALADAANDDGVTWIAVRSKSRLDKDGKAKLDILRKCSLSERAIQGAIKRLCSTGMISRTEVPGKGCTYTVHPTPAADAPRTTCAPQQVPKTPAADAGKPSVTVIEEGWEEARAILASDEWKAFAAMRRQIHKPINPTAQRRLLIKLRDLAEAGYPPGAVLEQSTANCWRGVFKISEETDDDNRPHHHRPKGASGWESAYVANAGPG